MAKPTLQVLTLEGVKEAARRAYVQKRLTAQHPDPSQRVCKNTLDGPSPHDRQYHCAIGCALSERTLRRIKAHDRKVAEADTGEARWNGCSVSSLIDKVIEIEGCTCAQLRDIQVAHDFWARASQENATTERVAELEQEFLALIQA